MVLLNCFLDFILRHEVTSATRKNTLRPLAKFTSAPNKKALRSLVKGAEVAEVVGAECQNPRTFTHNNILSLSCDISINIHDFKREPIGCIYERNKHQYNVN